MASNVFNYEQMIEIEMNQKREQNYLYKKIKFFEIEMLKDRGYKIEFKYFDKYYEITENYSWYIRLSFNCTKEDIEKTITKIQNENNFIDYDEQNMVIIDKKGLIICYSESLNELLNPVNIAENYNLDDILIENKIIENELKQEKSKYRINTGLFIDTLVIISNIEGIDKEKIQNLNNKIDGFVKFLVPTNKKNEYQFDIENKNLNLMVITPDALTSPSELFNDISFLFKNIEYFKYSELKFNVRKHKLVPQHKMMTGYETIKLLKDLKMSPLNISKELPLLKKDDRIARHYLFTKSNVIKIVRPSFIFPGRFINYYRYVI